MFKYAIVHLQPLKWYGLENLYYLILLNVLISPLFINTSDAQCGLSYVYLNPETEATVGRQDRSFYMPEKSLRALEKSEIQNQSKKKRKQTSEG